jgi:hypothetical protein
MKAMFEAEGLDVKLTLKKAKKGGREYVNVDLI